MNVSMRWLRIAAVAAAGVAGGDSVCQRAWAQSPSQIVPEQVAPPPGAGQPAEPQFNDPSRPYSVMVGDQAPEMPWRDVILGEPVLSWEKGRVYVLFPFALFCDPCLGELPRLTALQNEFAAKQVTIIGVTSPGPTHTQESVREFIFEKMADKIGFTIAWDRSRMFYDRLLHPAGRQSIPTVAIIDREGQLAFLGGAEAYVDVLRRVVSGEFEMDQAKHDYVNEIQVGWAMTHFDKFMREKQYADAYTLGREIVFSRGPDVYFSSANIAWAIVDPENPPAQQDLELALAAAARAYGLTKGAYAEAADTLARVHFVRGEFGPAVRHQTEAVALAKTDAQRARMQKSLDAYTVAQKQERSGVAP